MIDPKRLTGIADEGAQSIEAQLDLHRRLGWDSIELRTVDGTNVCEMDDRRFDAVADSVESAGFRTVGFASSIANWSRSAAEPFERDRDELLRAVPRMRRLNCRFIRIMSYISGGLGEDEWAKTSLSRVGELTRIAAGEGIVLLLENCDGWASASPANFARLLEEITDPALSVVFDPGNPLAHGLPEESVYEFFESAADRISHFHIKDCRLDDDGEVVHCYPGDGACGNLEIIRRLEASGYSGFYSIEPHMAVQIHKSMDGNAEAQSANYLEYGRRAQDLTMRI